MNSKRSTGSRNSHDLHQAPTAKDSGRPSVIIRFRMVQAISASTRWGLIGHSSPATSDDEHEAGRL